MKKAKTQTSVIFAQHRKTKIRGCKLMLKGVELLNSVENDPIQKQILDAMTASLNANLKAYEALPLPAIRTLKTRKKKGAL